MHAFMQVNLSISESGRSLYAEDGIRRVTLLTSCVQMRLRSVEGYLVRATVFIRSVRSSVGHH